MLYDLKAVEHFLLAEREGFEPSVPCGTLVFETSQFNHSCTSPNTREGHALPDNRRNEFVDYLLTPEGSAIASLLRMQGMAVISF